MPPGLVCSPRFPRWKDGKQLEMMCRAQGGDSGARWLRERGWSARKQETPAALCVTLTGTAPRKVCFHFQNESQGGEASPSPPSLCPPSSQRPPHGRAGSGAVSELSEPSWLLNPFLRRCGAGAGLLTLPQFPTQHVGPRLWVLAESLQLFLGFRPVFM